MRRPLLATLPLALLVAPAWAVEHAVDIRDNSYSPSSTTIAVGDVVTWTNRGTALHTVTFDNGVDSGPILPERNFSQKFETAGTYAYRCTRHPEAMRGTVVVQAAAGGTTTSTTRPSTTTTTARRTTTTLSPGESAVTAPGERPTTTTTEGTTTTVVDESTTTTTTTDGLVASASDSDDPGDGDEPSHAAQTAVAAILLAAVSGSAAFALKRGL